jgi:multidrug efflux pump subunit AcrA (membrane-fusion protein)
MPCVLEGGSGGYMKMEKVKKWAIAALITFLAIAGYWIVHKMLQSSAKVQEKIINVSSTAAASREIDESVVIQGIAEGDPQIKVYPQVPGKFDSAVAMEGSFVKKDDTILLINRDVVAMDFRLAPVKSPIDGIVTKIYYSDKGAAVSPQNPVAEVTNPGNIKVELNAGEEVLAGVKAGMAAAIKSVYGGGAPLKGYVYSCTPYIDTDTMAGTVIVKAKNVNNVIKPGTSVETTIITGKRRAIMLPETAVLMGGGNIYDYINDNGRAKKTAVTLGTTDGDEVEIKSGLTEGAEVITDGNFKLSDGAKISVK